MLYGTVLFGLDSGCLFIEEEAIKCLFRNTLNKNPYEATFARNISTPVVSKLEEESGEMFATRLLVSTRPCGL